MSYIMDKILIFGGTGSLGKKLIDMLLPEDKFVAVYSRDESKHWTIRNDLANHPGFDRLKFFVGDVRDKNRVSDVLRQYRPNTVIIAAALKHVDTCEYSPDESLATNVIGTQNIIRAVNEWNDLRSLSNMVTKVLFVSTDKACAPVNVYGMCKATSERLVTSQSMSGNKHVNYLAVRYGNVLESRGSIIPLFKYQAEHADRITITHPDMTRFMMTLFQSVRLIQTTLEHGNSGELWIPRLPAMRIGDLAELFSELSGKPIKVIGLRPGEKMHEDLINESESVRTELIEDRQYYRMQPAYIAGTGHSFRYTSNDDVMTKEQLKTFLIEREIFDAPLSTFPGKTIEEVMTNRKA